MRLIYTKPFAGHPKGSEVKVGDKVITEGGTCVEVVSFNKPHKPSSSGKICIREIGKPDHWCQELYVSCIDAEWIEREDRN